MYNLTLDEVMLCAKVFAYAMGDRSITLDQLDKDSMVVMLKKIADHRWDWSEQQKEQYKALVDVCSLSGMGLGI